MVCYGEKFVEKKIEENKIIRISEFKKFEGDYLDICIRANDCICDDPEELYRHGISLGYDDFYSIDCDLVLEWIDEMKEDQKEEDEEDQQWRHLEDKINLLEAGSGFIIFLDKDVKTYEE